jgi:hypothetical protein
MKQGCDTTAAVITLGRGFRLPIVVAGFIAIYWGFPHVRIPNVGNLYVFGDFGFWVTLLSPVWIPFLFASDLPWAMLLRTAFVLPAITWYLMLMLSGLMDNTSKIVVVAGTMVALSALALSFRGRWHLVAIPLWISILLGTVSVLMRSRGR